MSQPIVQVNQGILQGISRISFEGNTFHSFREIPYAEPPIGNLRFKDPVPAKGWEGVRDASKIGNVAPQTLIFGEDVYMGDDDCLHLSVHTPRLPPFSLLLPVILYLHGGGYTTGTGNENSFNPEFFVNEDIVVVSINSRLGVMGFLCLETKDAPGNMGLKDHTVGLKWVKDNIKHFGGDPNNVTLLGFSSGSSSVDYQVISPLADGLYHKVIMQSGTSINDWARNRKPLEYAARLVKLLGGNCTDPKEMYKFIAGKSTKELVLTSKNIINYDDMKNGVLFPFAPVFYTLPDHENFLNEDAIERLRNGAYKNIPTMCGFAYKEGISAKQIFRQDLQKEIAAGKGIEFIPEHFRIDRNVLRKSINEVYQKRFDDKNDDDFVIDFMSDIVFIGGIYAAIDLRMKHTEQYFYFFTHDRNANSSIADKGATHGDDIRHLGYLSNFVFTPNDILLRKKMIKMWSNFVKTGNPTPVLDDLIDVKWLPVSTDFNALEIGEKIVMRNGDPFPERRKLWVEIYKTS